jgi:CubicO group peptidase (beta-lactamase class C family)
MTVYESNQEVMATRPRAGRTACALLAITLLIAACGGSEPPLPRIGTTPQATGPSSSEGRLSWLRRKAIDRVLDYRVWSGARSGFVAFIATQGRVVYARTSGNADLETGTPMEVDTRFHLASMTKPIVAVAAMILVEEGRLDLDAKLSDYLPAFLSMRVVRSRAEDGGWVDGPATSPIHIRHLLTFTSGIGGYAETNDPLDQAWRSPDIELLGLGSLADRVDLVARLPLYEEPGMTWRYGWSADVLARVVEVAAQQPFDSFLKTRIFTPLGMTRTGYPDAVPADEPVARMYTHDKNGDLVRDPQFDDYYGRGWTPGGGGLVSTGVDFLRFAMMLAGRGELEGTRILSARSVEEMTRLHVPDGVLADMDIEGLGWGLGVCVVADDTKTLMPSQNGDYWWSGRFGTQFWIRPESQSVVVVMQQTERGPYSDLPITPTFVQVLGLP